MTLISKTVKVKWNSVNKKYYVNLGYEFTKMGDEFEVKVKDLTKGSSAILTCICDNCGHELDWSYYTYKTHVRENGHTYCNSCGNELIGRKNAYQTRLKKSKSFEQWCIENDKQEILDRWDYELNDCKPNEITYNSHKKYWFKCDKHIGHKSQLKLIKLITRDGSLSKCSQCNSLAQWMIDNDLKIEDYWDYKKNKISPWDISCNNGNKVWIKCQEKDYHENYEIRVSDFTRGVRCPYCSGIKVHPKDSLGQYIIDNYGEEFLWKVWSDKNKKSPFEYMPYGVKKVWWKCLDKKHEDYYRACGNSATQEFRCAKCVEERTESIIEEKTRLYLESLEYKILHEHKCTIRPINPKTKCPLPYDNEIVDLKLIVEVHGRQHYLPYFYENRNKCTYEEAEKRLYYQQVKDRYKRIYAIQHGYHYLEIPYTAFDKKETYKKLIDDKIKQIKNEGSV